jgi:hypothetical protein
MADDRKQRAPQDAARIKVNEDYEVQYWTQELGSRRSASSSS